MKSSDDLHLKGKGGKSRGNIKRLNFSITLIPALGRNKENDGDGAI